MLLSKWIRSRQLARRYNLHSMIDLHQSINQSAGITEKTGHGVEHAHRMLPTVAGLSKTKSDDSPASRRADLTALLTA